MKEIDGLVIEKHYRVTLDFKVLISEITRAMRTTGVELGWLCHSQSPKMIVSGKTFRVRT
jgi:hypothetical protein